MKLARCQKNFWIWISPLDETQAMKEDVACLLITNYFFLVKCTKTDHKSRQKAEKDFNRQYKPKKIDPPPKK